MRSGGVWRIGAFGVVGLAAALALLYWLMPLTGPVGREVPSRGGYAEAWAGHKPRPASFGGYTIENRTRWAEEVVSVAPVLQRPEHVHWGVGAVRVPPDIGVTHQQHPDHWYSLPHRFAAGQWWQPALTLRAPGPGVYQVDGLWVTYRWRSGDYRVYMPSTFAVCINKAQQCPAPPTAATRPRSSFWEWLQLAFS